MPREVDVLVIGTGAAGLSVAHKCRKAGRSVAIVDKRPFGGTCALRGCDPKKVMVGVASIARAAQRLAGHGINGKVRIDWGALMHFKRSFTQPVPEAREESLEKAGVELLHGVARFASREEVTVGETQLRPRRVVIAAGAKPAPLGIAGEEHIATSTDFLDLDALPARVLFVGGGYISMEFANLARRAGAEVTILHRGGRVLRPFDETVVRHLENATRDAGIDLRLETTVASVEKQGGALRVRGRGPDGDATWVAELVVHGAGRVPDVDDLELERAGIERGPRGGVAVEAHLRSTSRGDVWACGDAAESPGPPLTPVASLEGVTVAHNLLHDDTRIPNYRGTPSVAFCEPRLASVGLTEADARKAGKRFRVNTGESSEWFSSKRLREPYAAYKVLVEEGTDRILGAHLLGAHADDVINLFALAVRHDIPARKLRESLYAYPTDGSDVPYML